MPITFSCSCGKNLRVGDEHAGKRVKCPSCGKAVAVPAARKAAESQPAAPKAQGGTATATAPSGQAVRFGCECGKQLQAKAELAGKRIKCPSCGTTLLVPGETGLQTTKPAKKPTPVDEMTPPPKQRREQAAPDLGDEAEEEQPRPRKKGKPAKKAPLLLIIGAGVAALVLLAGGGFGGWYLFLREPEKPKVPPGPPVVTPKPPVEKTLTADLDLVPRDAAGFASARVAKIWESPLLRNLRGFLDPIIAEQLKEAQEKGGLTPADVDRATLVVLDANQDSVFAIVSLSKPCDKAKILAWLAPDAQEKEHQGKKYHEGKESALYFVNEQLVVASTPPMMPRFLDKQAKPSPTGPLNDALKLASGDHHLVIGGNTATQATADLRKQVPPEFTQFEALLDAQNGYLAASLGTDLQLELQATFPDEARAAKAKQALDGVMALARLVLSAQKTALAKDPANAEMLKLLTKGEQALQSVTAEPKAATVRMTGKADGELIDLLAGQLIPRFAGQAQGALAKATSANNLKQLAIAMHNHHDQRGRLPGAAILDKDGKPLLSWRVELLPYLDEGNLYNEFKKDEPWDSEHNLKLLPRMPKVFAPVQGAAPPHSTYYQVFVSPPAAGPMGALFGQPQGRKLLEILDGTSNTLLFAEAGIPVAWTKPDDLAYEPGKPLPRLGALFPDGFHVAFADGAVLFLRMPIDEKLLRAMITPAGGEKLP